MNHNPAPTHDRWSALPHAELVPTVDYVRRLAQFGGKYTLDQTFEQGWGNIVLDVSPRGLSTPTLRVADVTFRVHCNLLDAEIVLETDRGNTSVPLRTRSVADTYAEFVSAAASLGIPAPGTTIATEIPGALNFDSDHEVRIWDADAARLIHWGFGAASRALERWQAPYRGHRPRTGVMWGGFDLSATRYRGKSVTPPTDRPVFLQWDTTDEVVAVGFSFGSPESPEAALFAYIAPQPLGVEQRSWGAPGAVWLADAGFAAFPWSEVIAAEDPSQAIVDFGDAAYAAAVDLADWPSDLVGPRFSGWHASHTPPAQVY
ncbi:MAG: DUF5996 family protein [Terrimesophilobacter sp.]